MDLNKIIIRKGKELLYIRNTCRCNPQPDKLSIIRRSCRSEEVHQQSFKDLKVVLRITLGWHVVETFNPTCLQINFCFHFCSTRRLWDASVDGRLDQFLDRSKTLQFLDTKEVQSVQNGHLPVSFNQYRSITRSPGLIQSITPCQLLNRSKGINPILSMDWTAIRLATDDAWKQLVNWCKAPESFTGRWVWSKLEVLTVSRTTSLLKIPSNRVHSIDDNENLFQKKLAVTIATG